MAERELAGIIVQRRLAADGRVLARHTMEVAEVLREESGRSDLAMVGLRQPRPREKAQDFFVDHSRILEALPPCEWPARRASRGRCGSRR